MKHIKPYKIFENKEPQHPGFPTTEEEIHKICKEYYIENYTINDDLSIDVWGDVSLYNKSLIYLPINFNYVSGHFNICNNEILSLEGSPGELGGDFTCWINNLDTLEGSPKKINGNFKCDNNYLKTLKGGPHTVGGFFDCSSNKLMSLKHLPISNKNIIRHNPIYSIVNTFIIKDNAEDLIQEFNDYDIVRGDTVVLNRLKTFINDFDLDMPNLDEVRKHYKIV